MIKYVLLAILSVLLYSSCDKNDGDWDDNIKLSKNSSEFSANGDSVTITTERSWWWVNNIVVNNIDGWYSQPQLADSTNYSINMDSILVEQRDRHTLFIKANKNNSNVQRTIQICIEAGDYFDYVTIKQKGQ